MGSSLAGVSADRLVCAWSSGATRRASQTVGGGIFTEFFMVVGWDWVSAVNKNKGRIGTTSFGVQELWRGRGEGHKGIARMFHTAAGGRNQRSAIAWFIIRLPPFACPNLPRECAPRSGIRFLAEALRIGDGEPRRKPAGPGARRPRNPRRQDDSVPMILLPPWPWQSAAGVEPHPSDHRDRHGISPVPAGIFQSSSFLVFPALLGRQKKGWQKKKGNE